MKKAIDSLTKEKEVLLASLENDNLHSNAAIAAIEKLQKIEDAIAFLENVDVPKKAVKK